LDSLTQVVLGASVAGVCAPAGQRRKALLLGAALGTLPDLDVFIDYGDAVRNFTYHRAFSHSLFVLAPFALLLWLALKRWWAPVRDAPGPWLAAISLALLTHPLLFWPMTVPPTMWGTIFIIDPLYTLPLLIGVLVAAFAARAATARWFLRAGVALSTAYLGWTWIGQSIVAAKVENALAAQGLPDAPVFITPTPFNTLLWRIVVQTEDGYLEGFDSLLLDEPSIRFRAYPSDWESLREASNVWAVARLRWFSRDFMKAEVEGDRLLLSDLRMGQEPYYVFTHVAARRGNPHWQEVPTELVPVSFDRRELMDSLQRIWSH
jgi:inner membrane protein